MKVLYCSVIGIALLIPTFVQAESNQKPITSWTCEDFLTLDAHFQPMAIGFFDALNKKNNSENAVIDFDSIEMATPLVVEECMQNKNESFKSRVLNIFNEIKRKI
ncbi:acid-resistance protein [Salmonella enterica subsp. enterica]|nr:acid-resistance protein [Salmonella enterica subsp. enterica]